MARAPRQNPAGGWHHVMNRGARRQPIFGDDRDRATFLGLLDDLHGDDGVDVHAYCLMGNHYHLVLQCPNGNLSSAMHHLGSRYVQRFNAHHGVDGPLFRGRFRSKPISTDAYLVEAVRYVHRNPLELSTTGGLAGYRWSSYPAYLGLTPRPRWLTCSMVIDLASGSVTAYRTQVEADRPSETEVDDWSPADPAGLAWIDQVVAEVIVRVGDTVVSPQVRRRLGRDLGLVLAIDGRHATPAALAVHHGLASRSSVWSAVTRTRKRVRTDATMRLLLDRCRNALDQAARSEVSTLGA